MSTSNQTYKQYSFAHHAKVYAILEAVFAKYGINYYLIGANARDVQLYKQGIKPSRGTADIDFAIMVPDIDMYQSIFTELCDNGFKTTKEGYRLVYNETNTVLDLMPYGEIEQEFTVNFIDRDITLSVLGFSEVGEHIESVTIKEGNYTLPVSPIEGIIILKLMSWTDKPDLRVKDLEDISFLLHHAWTLYEDEAYENHLDLFDDDNFDTQIVAARIIGRKMKQIINQNDTLKNSILEILNKGIAKKDKAENPEVILAQSMNKSIEDIQVLLSSILGGINDSRK
ncbi:nucleotidyl transferase AbiEii/AbiGii toxin family protein [Winogradskyella wichelsiae]|uniref:nucleotidyl transferase AbiEii/AbiGii toxin family protein n=1 Tax=Winogradskyella wichelsiae TaxID=2697007 RepID=UPI0015C6D902|nr:nucleotidyl transferase AbiEii/AbiGii toxin family protein [Winogradskyella wichelsiae]